MVNTITSYENEPGYFFPLDYLMGKGTILLHPTKYKKRDIPLKMTSRERGPNSYIL